MRKYCNIVLEVFAKKRLYIFLYTTIIFTNSLLARAEFEGLWRDMQQEYAQLERIFPINNSAYDAYQTKGWKEVRQRAVHSIRGKSNHNFLLNYELILTMVRRGFGLPQKIEEAYLNSLMSESSKSKLGRFKDNDKELLAKDSSKFNCSTSTLGHLFYAGRILEHFDKHDGVFVEFGGGYGNLARIMQTILPEATYIIIDSNLINHIL